MANSNKPQYFEEAIRELSEEIAELIIQKQRDYGKGNILNAPLPPEQAILLRVHDKMSRLGNLLQKNKKAKNEPLEDSWIDIIGYSLVALMVRRGTFELPLKKEK